MLHKLFDTSKKKQKPKVLPVNSNVSKPIARLIDMLKYKRPANSVDVSLFIERYIEPVCNKHGGFYDEEQNYIVKIGKETRVLFSSHTDTVHVSGGIQKLSVNGDYIKLHRTETSNCLGADDTTGVWLMLEMIRANVSGLYIFHASEEIGGIGSSYIARYNPSLVAGIDFCIAFDRKDIASVITHQGGARCCSDEFSASLMDLLPIGYRNDTGGTFTDSANYTDIIPECTNVSIGYFDQHTNKEMQSISHAMLLRESMLCFDETKLVCKRVAGEIDYSDNRYYYKSYNTFDDNYYDLYDYVRNNPDIVADFLNDNGYDISYFHKTNKTYKNWY